MSRSCVRHTPQAGKPEEGLSVPEGGGDVDDELDDTKEFEGEIAGEEVSGTFALVVPTEFDRLYDTVRRTELVSWLLHLYEARTGQALICNFMQSILLTLENGETMTTYFDEAKGTVAFSSYKKF